MRKLVLPLLLTTAFAVPVAGWTADALARPPVQTGPPSTPDQSPAFPEQTRAPQPAEATKVAVETVAKGLPRLWAMEFLPDGRMLVTAKAGEMHIIGKGGEPGDALKGVPKVDSAGQGGLLDVALAPDFAESGTIFISYAEPREGGGNGTSVARAKLVLEGDTGALEDLEVIFRQTPAYDGDKHFGSRLAFDTEGRMFVAVGERSDEPIRDQAQDLESGLGKVFRINQDGSIPKDNPFADSSQPAIWSYGHRNTQSAVTDSEGRLWIVEHGPKGGDELNRPEAGKNYGWPTITYGVAYSGAEVGEGKTEKEGMEQPLYYWDPVIAPSGMAIYTGDAIPAWRDALLIGGLVSEGLVVLKMDGDKVATEEWIDLDARIRDVKVGPDGAVYAVTETRGLMSGSTILRISAGS